MEYSDLIEELVALRDEQYAAFQRRIVRPRSLAIFGVRTPALRSLVKKYRGNFQVLRTFPGEYYEVVFLQLNVAALLPYEEFCRNAGWCVERMDNWALCDMCKAACLREHREDFLPYVEKFLRGGEFAARYALVTLLYFYVEEEYLSLIFDCLQRVDRAPYYTFMAAAWLLAEVLVKFYAAGTAFLKQHLLDARTHNMAIRKARESFRLTAAQKEELNALKRK